MLDAFKKLFLALAISCLITSCTAKHVENTARVACLPLQIAIGIPCLAFMGTCYFINDCVENIRGWRDVTCKPCFKPILDKKFTIKEDLFLCKEHKDDLDICYLVVPEQAGKDAPKGIEEYLGSPQKWIWICGVIEKGTEIQVTKIFYKNYSYLTRVCLFFKNGQWAYVDVDYLFAIFDMCSLPELSPCLNDVIAISEQQECKS